MMMQDAAARPIRFEGGKTPGCLICSSMTGLTEGVGGEHDAIFVHKAQHRRPRDVRVPASRRIR